MVLRSQWNHSIYWISSSLVFLMIFNLDLTSSGPVDEKNRNPTTRERYTALVVFGDSYSDNGHSRTPEYQNSFSDPPSLGGRYCDGIVWNEFLVKKMSIENNVTLLNYAYNGAHINSSLTYNPPPKVVPDTRTQINTYIEEVTSYLDSSPEPQEVHSNILHVLWIGINPILYHWLRINIDVSHEETMNDVQPEIDQEVEALVQQLSDLAQSSSRLKTLNFTPQYIVLNVPPLHKTVFGRKAAETLSGSDSRLMSRYLGILLSMIEYFNKRLVESIGALKSSGNQINVKIKIFDAMSFWNQVQSKPYEYGLLNLTACYPVTSQPPCKQPSAYEYWDSLHPTTSFHSLLSDEILRFL